VSLPDTTVSQLHARVFRRDGRVYVEDLGSTNGTWLNRARVSAAVPMKRGDRLQFGSTVLEVAR
jgi:pSer/pThr/pTyr-binding forkhead associated (FHA) protein